MNRLLNSISLGCLLCLVILVNHAVHAQTQYVRAVPQCGHSEYDNSGNWYLIDTCNIDVTITFNNSVNGPTWGQAHVGAGQRQLTETMGNADPRENGTISLFTCPGTSIAVTPNGRAVDSHYHGEYRCQQN